MQFNTKTIKRSALLLLVIFVALSSCRKLSRPALGDYPQDANPPGGALKFYAAFNGTTSNPLMNAVDSIRANFPSDNPFTTEAGVAGKSVTGVNKKYIKY